MVPSVDFKVANLFLLVMTSTNIYKRGTGTLMQIWKFPYMFLTTTKSMLCKFGFLSIEFAS